jgi:hypothetical protein
MINDIFVAAKLLALIVFNNDQLPHRKNVWLYGILGWGEE